MIDNEIVTADAKVFPLIDLSDESDNLFSDRESQLEIDSLTPYVDLARMSRERYDKSPSIPNGARMSKDRNELVARLKRATDSLCGRYPSATREDVWMMLLERFGALRYVFQGLNPEIQSEVAHV